MKSKDQQLLEEAYFKILERANPNLVDTRIFKTRLSQIDPVTAKQLIKGGTEDRNAEDDVVLSKQGFSAPANSLFPGQSNMDLDKFIGMAIQMAGRFGGFASGPGGDLAAIISKDNRLMDGHHRWFATLVVEPKAIVKGLQIDMPYEKLLGILNVWTKALDRTGKTATIPISQITGDIVQKRFIELASADDKFSKAQDKAAAFQKIGLTIQQAAQNAKVNWENNTPWKDTADKLPPKVDMPVIEPNELEGVADTLSKGNIDVNPPYSPKLKQTGDKQTVANPQQ
jgi:hypothetical protein